ncbi:Hypothetical predicted protein, partial [Scomber scombrus]
MHEETLSNPPSSFPPLPNLPELRAAAETETQRRPRASHQLISTDTWKSNLHQEPVYSSHYGATEQREALLSGGEGANCTFINPANPSDTILTNTLCLFICHDSN